MLMSIWKKNMKVWYLNQWNIHPIIILDNFSNYKYHFFQSDGGDSFVFDFVNSKSFQKLRETRGQNASRTNYKIYNKLKFDITLDGSIIQAFTVAPGQAYSVMRLYTLWPLGGSPSGRQSRKHPSTLHSFLFEETNWEDIPMFHLFNPKIRIPRRVTRIGPESYQSVECTRYFDWVSSGYVTVHRRS